MQRLDHAFLRLPDNRPTVLASPFPGLKALIVAVGDVPIDLDADKNV